MKKHLAHLWIGLATAAFLFGISFFLYFSMSYMGERDANVEKIILENFQFTIIRFALKLLLLYLAAGGVFALFRVCWDCSATWPGSAGRCSSGHVFGSGAFN